MNGVDLLHKGHRLQRSLRQEPFVSLLVLFHFIFTLPCQVGHLVNLNVHRHLLHHFVRITIPKSRISQVSAPCLQPCQPPYQRPPLQLHSFFIWSECHYHQGHAGSWAKTQQVINKFSSNLVFFGLVFTLVHELLGNPLFKDRTGFLTWTKPYCVNSQPMREHKALALS